MKLSQIVIVNDFAYVNGGAGQVALGSALALSKQGYDVTVFSAVGPAMAELREGAIKLICTKQHEIASDPNRMRAAMQGLWNREASQQLDTLLARLDRDRTIVHLHGWSKSLSSSISRTAVTRGFPTVLTMHDYFLACPNGGFYNYQSQKICTLKPMSPACLMSNCDKHSYSQKLWRSGRQAMQAAAGKLPDGISDFIAISDFSRRILEPYLPTDARVHLVPNPIAIEQRPPVVVARNEAAIYVGRLEPEKGVTLLAHAARRAEMPAVFVGEGSQREQVMLTSADCEITGWLDPAGVQQQLDRARCLVLPSRWYETQGLVVLEAAARGVPAIVPDQCAASELVEDGVTGLIFRTGDVIDLEQKLRLLSDPDRAAQFGRAAYHRYWQNPATMDRHVAGLVSVYQLMLSRPTAHSVDSESISAQ